MAELPVRAVIKSRFDLGFVLQHPDSRFGELRVSEMSRSTAEWDRSPDADAGIGNTVDVYVVRDTGDGYLFSEFSADERTAREQRHQGWLAAQEQARVGSELFVRVERKLEWGCISGELWMF